MESSKLTLECLCKWIDLPDLITKEVLRIESELNLKELNTYLKPLFQVETWSEIVHLKEYLGEDQEGLKMLTVMLIASLHTYELYQRKGISDVIYIESIACFRRFAHEHLVSYGTNGFDREWWTVRQISAKLFRIGELEYEMVQIKGENKISVHIPSDARITLDRCRASYEKAIDFFHTYFNEFEYDQMVCDSWLLSPALKEILDEDSNIYQFQSQFQIVETYPEEEAYREWVYKRCPLPIEELPEDTTLQRNMKKYLLSGGKVGTAYGYLVKEPFLYRK